MTIKTLEYIHMTLKEDLEKRREAKEGSRKLANEYENRAIEDPTLKDLAREQNEAANQFAAEYYEAFHALRDFEAHEWR